ncbi:MAG: hypothetical protein R3C11_10135 [Planctomycetaceae bacterium]
MDDVRPNQEKSTLTEPSYVLRVFSYARELTATVKPNQPVYIGSGPDCHIRIEALPTLHSTVTYDGQQAPLMQLHSPIPPVLLNGKLREGYQDEPISLRLNETIHIGLRVIVRLASARSESLPQEKPLPKPSVQPVMETSTSTNSEPSSPVQERENLMNKPLNELTAAELVELIEQEEKRVADFEAQQKSGLSSLLKAIKKVSDEEERNSAPATIPLTHLEQAPANNNPPIERELHFLVEELSELVEDLCEQVQTFAISEASSPAGAETTFKKMLREQHDILEKLDTIAELIGNEPSPPPVIRKAA